MPDSSVLWLAADQNAGRELFEAGEGYEMWPLNLHQQSLAFPDAHHRGQDRSR